jgi:hypothetical protein
MQATTAQATTRPRSLLWLGAKRGYLSDWITQRWVEITGQRVDLQQQPWLQAPVGKVDGIGKHFFAELAIESDLELQGGGERGLLPDFAALRSSSFEPAAIHPVVIRFYERTSQYDLDAWSEWCGAFRPFGWLLAALFSRRLQQLNVPLSALDTSRGVTSEIVQLIDRGTRQIRLTAWVRELVGTRDVLYAGSYSVCAVPGYAGPCVKVAFPLPNGNALVIMKPEAHHDGSFSVTSSGSKFGDPGFYFTVHLPGGGVVARYVAALRESIRVYAAENDVVRADHVLTFWGMQFLRLHYRLRGKPATSVRTP